MNQPLTSFAVLLPLLALLSACAAPLAPVATKMAAPEPVEHQIAHVAELEVEPAVAPVVELTEEAPASRECPVDGTRVLLIGDSLSAGLGPVMAKHAAACSTPFHHHGVVGSHVTEWAHDSWLVPQLAAARPNLVIISMGGNDFGRRDQERVQRGIDVLVNKVRASGARLLWISPPTMPFRDRIGVRGMWQHAMDGVDMFATEELSIPRTEDRIHPTRGGYQDLARTLWQWMANA